MSRLTEPFIPAKVINFFVKDSYFSVFDYQIKPATMEMEEGEKRKTKQYIRVGGGGGGAGETKKMVKEECQSTSITRC